MNPIDAVETINKLAAEVHQRAITAGWWDARNEIQSLADENDIGKPVKAMILMSLFGLVMSEAGEAIDNVRLGMPPDDKVPQWPGAAAETADIIIRCLDLAASQGWPIGDVIADKMACNVKRGHMHGGKLA